MPTVGKSLYRAQSRIAASASLLVEVENDEPKSRIRAEIIAFR
jgi:hypothetical protein